MKKAHPTHQALSACVTWATRQTAYSYSLLAYRCCRFDFHHAHYCLLTHVLSLCVFSCFMNSILQSMAHAPILTTYFLSSAYLKEINRTNPLGWNGRIAEEYGSLLQQYWSNRYNVVAPRAFKQALGEFQPRFSGYQQHDSQELLSFLLDGLHEDLNRVMKKPATQGVESGGREDEVVAAEAWDVYKLRNRSVVVDHMMGQLKSRVVCPQPGCGQLLTPLLVAVVASIESRC